MTTVPYKPGASGPFVVRFENEAGGQENYQAVQLRVQAGGACIPITGILAQDGYEFPLPDLPPKLYTATIYADAGSGWRFKDKFYLLSEGGC